MTSSSYHHDGKQVESALSDDEEEEYASESSVLNGQPFSALTPSMRSQELLSTDFMAETKSGLNDYIFDEFGFKVEGADLPEKRSKILSTPFVEDSKHKLKWIAFLEFNCNTDLKELTFDQNNNQLPKTQRLHDMVIQHGIPHSLRAHIWPRLCGAASRKVYSDQSYQDIVRASTNENLISSKQIEKDLLRTLPTNICFRSNKSTGVGRLRRILRGLAWLYPDIGYCQGMGVLVASLLLHMEEEDAFWLVSTIIEDILPASYFSTSLIGVQADQHVLQQLIASCLPDVDLFLKKHEVELSLITLDWFVTAFTNVLHPRLMLRVFDLFFYQGSITLFQIALAILKLHEKELLKLENSSDILSFLSKAPTLIDDEDGLIQASVQASQSFNTALIESHRKKHLAYLMAEQGAILNPEQTDNLPKQKLTRRKIARASSIFSYLLWGLNDDSPEDEKAKNIKQTELIVDLRAAILQICRYFQSNEPHNKNISLDADYSLESHSLDLDNYIKVVNRRMRRAKALVDFEQHDNDELGFKKNDVIMLISTNDEHCWVGEINGKTGWFPAKFVEVLDERSKDYSYAGDDSVSGEITDLVRGALCSSIKAILEYGLKKSMLLGGVSHPWLFIEQAIKKDIEKDYQSTYARLVLCKAFRLDEDGKVLTPEEVLYKAVQAVNASHNQVNAQMDVKLRSLICLGLNEQVLHLWLECLCSCEDAVEKWYHSWSFIRSPGWVQIKCDLRLLAQFAFYLERDHEIVQKRKEWESKFLVNVQEMLAKYHLFSWEMS